MDTIEVKQRGARAARLLILHYLVSDLGHKKSDFLCGISSEVKYNTFLQQSSIAVHSSYSVKCENKEVAAVCIDFMRNAGFKITDNLYEDGGTLVFIYKVPNQEDEEYLQFLSERIEKSGMAYESLMK